MSQMTLPNVLNIGAMKSGTTGVFMDLVKHPDFYEPQDKEPGDLCSDLVFTEAGLEKYANRYATADKQQIICDASTTYTKRPDIEGVAQRAVQVLPADFKVIYVVRHPIRRILSQHWHELTDNQVSLGIDDAVRQYERFVAYSRYAYQLEPWIAAVGLDRIRVVQFEEYMANREQVIKGLWEFLGLQPPYPTVDKTVYNQSSSKPILNGFWSQVRTSWVYQTVRPLISLSSRKILRELILPKANDKPAPPTPETIQWLNEELSSDYLKLVEMLQDQAPRWNDLVEV